MFAGNKDLRFVPGDMRVFTVVALFLLVVGCRTSGTLGNLPKAKARADLVILCSATHSGRDTEYKMIRSLYFKKGTRVPYKPGDVVSSFTRLSSDTYTHDRALIFYETSGGKLFIFSELPVYGDRVPAYGMTLDDVIDELRKP